MVRLVNGNKNVLPLFMSIKHGITTVNVPNYVVLPLFMSKTWYNHGKCPKQCGFTIVHVHKTWYNHGKCPQKCVYHCTCP